VCEKCLLAADADHTRAARLRVVSLFQIDASCVCRPDAFDTKCFFSERKFRNASAGRRRRRRGEKKSPSDFRSVCRQSVGEVTFPSMLTAYDMQAPTGENGGDSGACGRRRGGKKEEKERKSQSFVINHSRSPIRKMFGRIDAFMPI
jgi:hypothetical protein